MGIVCHLPDIRCLAIKFIFFRRGEKDLRRSGEETILANTVESLIMAIFLDSDVGSVSSNG